MPRTRIKICGITTPDAAIAAAAAGADAIGLVFVPGSPRLVSLEVARDIVAALPAFVEPIGLFVNNIEHARRTADALRLRTVQLHGDESPQDVVQLAPLRVLKSIGFQSRYVSDHMATWRDVPNVAGVLFDAPPSSPDTVAGERGGSGRRFDWDALARLVHGGVLHHAPPMFLAGGLTPDNVADAISMLHPYAVDVSSGVESTRGIKDASLILAFCDAVRAADATERSATIAAS